MMYAFILAYCLSDQCYMYTFETEEECRYELQLVMEKEETKAGRIECLIVPDISQ